MRSIALFGMSLALTASPGRVTPATCADPTPDSATWWSLQIIPDGPNGGEAFSFPQAPELPSARALEHVRGRFRLTLNHTVGPDSGRVDSASVMLIRGRGRVTGVELWSATLNLPRTEGVGVRAVAAYMEARDARLTLVVGREPDTRRDGAITVTKDGAGINFHIFGGDERRMRGRWVDGGLRGTQGGPAQGWFCLERV